MTTRSHVVRLEAEVSKYTSNMAKGEKATAQLKKAAEELGKAVDEVFEKGNDHQSKELAQLAEAHQKAAKAANLSYDAQGNLVDQNGRLVTSNRAAVHGLDAFSDAVYKTEFAAEQAAEAERKLAAQAEAAAKKHSEASREMGTGLLAFGTASVAALGASTKAAMDWESAWAGVTKTVDGSPEQMKEIEQGLRGLAKAMPGTHEEIAAVAEAAGALGVKRQDIIAFTKTMIDLGNTTNLSADEAATSIAQFLNVMGDAGGDVDNLGSTLVALGNDGASTEKEIMSMAQRISGAGKLVGATKPDIMALASTLASLGIQAELGGGVTSRVMQRMYADVMNGGESLNKLAKVSGVSSAEFSKAWNDNPVKAMDMVFQGLNNVKSSGGNVVETMEQLGIKGTEETGVVLRLAGAGDLLTKSLEVGNKAWQENSALTDEATKRYETAESKVKIAWNNIKDAAIDAGAVVLPIVQQLAESAVGVAQGFGSLPQPLQAAITVLTGVVGVASLGAGAFLTLVPKIRDTKDALKVLAPEGSKANAVIGKTGKLASGAAIGIAALGAAAMGVQPVLDGLYKPTGETAEALRRFNGEAASGTLTAKTLNDSFSDLVQGTNGVSNFQQAINGIADPGLWGNVDNIAVNGINILTLGMAKAESTSERARDRFRAMSIEMAGMDPAKANMTFRTMAAATDGSATSLNRLLEYMPEYRKSLEEQAKASGRGTDNQTLLNIAMSDSMPAAQKAQAAQDVLQGALEETGVQLDGVVEDMQKFLDMLFATGMATMSSREAASQYAEAFRSIPGVLKEIADSGGKMGATLLANKTDFDLSTEAGSKANAAFQTLAQKGMNEVKAKADEGVGMPGLQEKLNTTYLDLLTAANGMGIVGDDAVALARKVLGIPDGVSIESWMSSKAKETADNTKKSLDAIDGRVVKTYTEHQEKTIKIIETQIRQQGTQADPSDTAFKPGTFAPGKAKGGLAGAFSGRVPGKAPTDLTKDNVMALLDGKHYLPVQSDEWIINGRSSNKYNDELAAINAGTFPKYNEPSSMASSRSLVTVVAPAAAAAPTGPFALEGQLVLEGGQFLGMVRGIVHQEATAVVASADTNSRYIRKGR